MKLKSIFKKTPVTKPEVKEAASQVKPEVPEGLLKRCNKCGKGIFTEDYKKNLYICPKCGGYLRMPAQKRIAFLTEKDSFEEWDTGLTTENPLHMIGYPDRIKSLQEKTKLDEAVITGKARIGANEVALMVMDGRFLMASMGEVVGEKIARGVERATKEKLPVIIFTCSGGARMQEGMTSLMQMAKTSAALKRHSDAGLLYITVLTDPTTGGVTASFAMLGDIILAEPKALIGFAGPRVIEQTIHKKLPKGFQRSEFLLKHGFIDKIVERKDMKTVLEKILTMHRLTAEGVAENTGNNAVFNDGDITVTSEQEVGQTVKIVKNSRKQKLSATQKKRASEKTAWERVLTSREKDRPVGEDYISGLFEEFIEFHGDRNFGDDAAICGGIAYFQGQPVTVIAQMKGKSTSENIERNFGMPEPEGYRKAQLRGTLDGMDTTVITELAEYYEKEIGYHIPERTPFVGKNFNVTRAGIHADGLLKNEEIYNIFDTDKLLNRPVLVAVSNTSGLAGIAHWMNTYYRLKGDKAVDKKSPLVEEVKKWVDKEYETGRVTAITDSELEKVIKESSEKLGINF